MPRLIKYNTDGFIDDVPDEALALLEHTILWMYASNNFSGNNKFYAYGTIGFIWEIYIDRLKKQSTK
tara:strand:- start:138 stop:338 length:201 start_codon:yes stop_codon:yes gene_type:complete